MALSHFGRQKGYANLAEPPIYGQAPSLREIMRFSSAHGLFLKAYRLERKEKVGEYLREPLLAMIQEDGLTHMIYLKKKRLHHYLAYDPSSGKRWIKEGDFLQRFTGIFLKKEHFTPKKEDFPKPVFIKRRTLILLDLLRCLSILLVFLGFYFVDEEGSFPLTALLLAGFAASSVLSRFVLSRQMLAFDRKYLDSLLLIETKKRKEAYLHFLRFKTGVFSREPSLVAGALEIAALLVLFTLNELWMGLAMLGLSLLLLLERAILYPRFLRRSGELARVEEDFLSDSRTPGHEKASAGDLSRLTYRLADIACLRDYAFYTLEGLLALMVTFLSSSSTSLNAFFVWMMGLYLFGEEYGKFLSSLFGKEEFLKEEAYFLGHFAPKG